MPRRPDIVENLSDETTHARALTFLVDDEGPGRPLAVATGYVNLSGLHHLAALVDDGRPVRILVGAVPDPGLGAQVPLQRFELSLVALSKERDLARFPPSRAAKMLNAIDEWLAGPEIEVRRYLTRFLHGKAYLVGSSDDARAALVTSANLTGAGLEHNLELGMIRYDPEPAERALHWFDQLWNESADFKSDLRALLFPDPGLHDPQSVYLRALLDLYGEELESTAKSGSIESVELAGFQRDGYERALGIVARHHGAIYADGVGTGKTEVGLAFIEEYALRRGFHALVITPAQLKERWKERIDRAKLPAQVVSFNEIAADEQLVPDATYRRRILHNARDTYRLVVIDEGHALRNPDTTWHRAVNRLLGGERKDVLLLTATPINNGLWDLYHIVMLFARHDRAFIGEGVDSVRELFVAAGANERDPENLAPDILFPLADAVSVRRDRRFIVANYPGATFPDGTPVRFPRPITRTRRYDLDVAHPGLVADIVGWIGGLTMARYRPSAYEISGEEAVAEATLSGLLQSQILKRFESCWIACLKTIELMITAHDVFLDAWEDGIVLSQEALRAAAKEVEESGAAAWDFEALEDEIEVREVGAFDPAYREDVSADRDLLVKIRDRLSSLTPEYDTKLALLLETIESLTRDGVQKIAVFATYGDTVRYIDENLPAGVAGREREVVIGTESDPDSRTRSLARFAPKTVVREDYVPPDGEVDLLISTDVLSEGQNLQQAAAVISYDMPWNPQRVIQRNGRVIRLKSPHDEVYLTTMLPEPGDLEEFLKLEAAIRRKVLSARLYGLESGVIDRLEAELDEVEPELRAFASALEDGDASLLDEEADVVGSFSGEELRAELLRAMSEGELGRLWAMPWGVGAVFAQGAGVPSRGRPGVFFACRTSTDNRYWRYVEFADGTTTVDPNAAPITGEGEILPRIDPGDADGLPLDEINVVLEDAWRRAVESVVAEHNRRADPRNVEQSIGPVQKWAVDLLRDPGVKLAEGASAAEEALTVGRSSAVRRALSAIRAEVSAGSLSRDNAAARVVEAVQELGLQPVEEVAPLTEITEDDVGVVCWMAVLPATERV